MAGVCRHRASRCAAWVAQLILLLICIPARADLNASDVGEQPVVDVRVVGNITNLNKLPRLATRVGAPFEKRVVEEDVRALAKTHKFIDVQPQIQQVQGGVIVIFQVQERPTFQYVKYLGNRKISDKSLQKETDIDVGAPMDPYAVKEGQRKIEDAYHEKGFNNVTVTIMEGDRIGDRGAIYVISEGVAQHVSWTTFEGNTIASSARLRTQVETKPGILWLFSGYVDRKKIDSDMEKLAAYYRGLGFFRAKIGRELEFNENGDWLTIKFVIDEGPRYSVRNISFIGNQVFATEDMRTLLKAKTGKPFDQAAMNHDLAAVRDIYGGHGYIFADVQADPRLLEEANQLDLIYSINEGDRYRVGKINVHIGGDNPHTREKTVYNRLSLHPGELVDTRKLRNDERRLKASGLFLADPAKGNAPKIVFTPPPGVEGGEQIGSKPSDKDRTKKRDGEPSFRGQSPDPQPREHVVDLEWFCTEDPTPDEPHESGSASQAQTWEQALQAAQPAARNETARQVVAPQAHASTAVAPLAQTNSPATAQAPRWTTVERQTAPSWDAPRAAPRQTARVAENPTDLDVFVDENSGDRFQNNLGMHGDIGAVGRVGVNGNPAVTEQNPSANRPQPTWQAVTTPSAPVPSTAVPAAAVPIAPRWDAPPRDRTTPGTSQITLRPISPESQAEQPVRSPYDDLPTPRPAKVVVRAQSPDGAFSSAAGATGPASVTIAPTPATVAPSWGGPHYRGQSADPNAPQTIAPANGQPGRFLPAPYAGPNYAAQANGVPATGPGLGLPPFPMNAVDPVRLPSDPTVPLDAYVDETQTGRIMFGIGVNSDAGLVGNILLEEQNFDWQRVPTSWEDVRSGQAFRGAGQRFRIEASPGTEVQRYAVSFTEPYLFDTPVSLNLSGSYYERQYDDWEEKRGGGRVGFGYQLTPDLTLGTSFRLENVNLSNPIIPTPPELTAALGSSMIYAPKISLTHDTRDSAFLPTEGHLIDLAYEYVFGDFQYSRETIEGRQYFLLHQRPDGSGRQTLGIGSRAGFSGTDTPIYDEFYAGGFSTMRGFSFRNASPRDLDVAVGGNFEFLNTIEYSYPITANDMLRAVSFVDFGTVERNVKIDWEDFRIAPGFGLRISIPAFGPAPIALDFAFPVHKAPGDRTQIFSFFVGVNR